MIDRPKFKEMTYDEFRRYDPRWLREGEEKYDTVELKMDGIWGCMVIANGEYNIYSRTGKIKQSGSIKHDVDMILLGEFMKGSHWAHKHGLDGKFFVFDCLKHKKDLASLQLRTRRLYITKSIEQLYNLNMDDVEDINHVNFIRRLKNYSFREGWSMWYHKVKRQGYEGLVLKDSKSYYGQDNSWARVKMTTEIDYMCVGFQPSDPDSKYTGQVGAVTGSLIDKPCKVQCGGLTEKQRLLFTANPDDYIGRVFKATGHGWFPSGSVRHPKFSNFRDDKRMMECTYDQIPEIHRED
tara:strand:- start:1238 stop:2122 length:885 start_codon:yes stop_codon:yes gene_type:complete